MGIRESGFGSYGDNRLIFVIIVGWFGQNPNCFARYVLMFTAKKGGVELIVLLLREGFDIVGG